MIEKPPMAFSMQRPTESKKIKKLNAKTQRRKDDQSIQNFFIFPLRVFLRLCVFASLRFIFFIFCFVLTSCTSNSLEDFRDEGRHTTRALIAELKKIETHQDFAPHSLKLKKLFLEQVQIIDRMHQWRQKHPEAKTPELIALDYQLSEKLEKELARIAKIEGGKKFLQKCQQEALHYQKPKRPLKARASVPPST